MVIKIGTKTVLISLVMGLVSIPCMLKNSIAQAKDEVVYPPEVNEQIMCYDMVTIDPPEIRLEDLEAQLESLEKLHKENKINQETYEKRKKSLQREINTLKTQQGE